MLFFMLKLRATIDYVHDLHYMAVRIIHFSIGNQNSSIGQHLSTISSGYTASSPIADVKPSDTGSFAAAASPRRI